MLSKAAPATAGSPPAAYTHLATRKRGFIESQRSRFETQSQRDCASKPKVCLPSEVLLGSYFPVSFFPLARHHKLLSVRINNSPSDGARDALVGSLTELVASTSNFGPARSTNTSPD